MKLPRKEFGKFIKEKRKAAGFKTQQALADALGADQPLVGKWEAGINLPKGENLKNLSEILKFNPETVFSIISPIQEYSDNKSSRL